MAEKFAFDYVNEILGIVNYVREVLRPAFNTGTAEPHLNRIIACSSLTIGPRIDVPEPLFVTEPDRDDEMVDEFIELRTDLRIDAETGEVL